MSHPLDGNLNAIETHLAEGGAAHAGDQEGERCNVGGCSGEMFYDDVEGCSSHINPLICDECGRDVE